MRYNVKVEGPFPCHLHRTTEGPIVNIAPRIAPSGARELQVLDAGLQPRTTVISLPDGPVVLEISFEAKGSDQ